MRNHTHQLDVLHAEWNQCESQMKHVGVDAGQYQDAPSTFLFLDRELADQLTNLWECWQNFGRTVYALEVRLCRNATGWWHQEAVLLSIAIIHHALSNMSLLVDLKQPWSLEDPRGKREMWKKRTCFFATGWSSCHLACNVSWLLLIDQRKAFNVCLTLKRSSTSEGFMSSNRGLRSINS